jgi:ribosome-binding protein aMBF1 (putative translation factor)
VLMPWCAIVSWWMQGLADECPRCGEVMECASDDVEAHRAHLQGCRDRGKIEAHHKRQKVQQVRNEHTTRAVNVQQRGEEDARGVEAGLNAAWREVRSETGHHVGPRWNTLNKCGCFV